MQTKNLSYQDEETTLKALVVSPDDNQRPVVILCHGWAGRDAFIEQKAYEIAEWGYLCFCLDMYGDGIVGSSPEQNAALKKPFVEDRRLLMRRVTKAFNVACSLPQAQAQQVAAVGFGFGGMCAVDLARSGEALAGVASIYGHFHAPPLPIFKPISAKMLILHGYNDPIVNQDELRLFIEELEHHQVDWQAHIFGHTLHAFATPGTNRPESGLLYHEASARRAWIATKNFLDELF